MKKTVLDFLSKAFSKSVLLICITTLLSFAVSAQNTFNVASGNWNTAGNWSLAHVPNGTESLVIPSGSTCNMDVSYTGGNTAFTLTLGGTLNIPSGISFDKPAGTVLMNANGATLSGGGSINLYILTVNTPNATDVVNFTNSSAVAPIVIGKSNTSGTINFTKGFLKLTGQTLAIAKTATINGNGGNFANSADGAGDVDADGGTIFLQGNSGGTTTVNGSVTFNNIDFGTDGNVVIDLKTATSVINGTAKLVNQQGKLGNSNSPIWGASSNLNIVYSNNFNYTPGKEWLSMASGTIGVTPGYPSNVTLSNTGNSAGGFNNGNGWVPSGAWAINGVLTLGNNSNNAQVDFSNLSSFTCGGFVLNANSRFTAPKTTMTVNGNWTDNQAVSGTAKGFFINGTSMVVFGGTALCSAPNTITAPAGNTEAFYSLTINTNVSLSSPVSVNAAGSFVLTSVGILTTTSTNILTINNTATGAVSGGTTTSYINGPVKWNLGTAAGNYAFPVGVGACTNAYLPFTINKPASNATVATVQAFNAGSGGTPDATITTLSQTEYWSLTTSVPFTNGANVSVSRSIPLGSYNMVGMSQTAASGTYTAIGGTVGVNDITNAGTIGNNSPWYFALANGPLIARVVNVVTPKCSGTVGSVTIGASGGTAPYQYATETGNFSSNNLFENLPAGKYIFRVKDQTGTIATATVILKPLSTIADTTICSGNVTLTTSGAFSYSWTSSPAGFTSTQSSPIVSPTVNTTYYVNALILDNSVNMITNGDFESGVTGFTSDYINLTGNGQIPYNAANQVGAVGSTNHNGIYAVVAKSNDLCNFFTPSFNDHTTGSGKMMVLDGPSNSVAGQAMWSETVSVIPGNSYVLSYYFSNANNNATSANVQTLINGTTVASTTGFSANPYATTPAGAAGWNKISYFWTAPTGVTSAAISLIDLVNNADIGNDFAIDDITMYNTCTVTDSVKVNVGSSTAPTAPSPVTYCQNANAVPLTAVGTSLKWYDSNNQLLASAPTPSTTTVGPTTYYVTETPLGGCGESPKATIVVNVTSPNTLPTFTAIAPICAGGSFTLPTTSNNGITGTWLPAPDNQGTKLYTFTPAIGQCATTATLTVTVNQPVAPAFTAIAPICAGGSFTLPTTSTNGITGTWSPAPDNQGTQLYTFTPAQGQCATTATLTVTVNQPVAPAFTAIAPICAGGSFTLPTTSNNGITGTWLPAINNQGTTEYTFTPAQGQCATTTKLSVTVNQPVTPTFNAIAPICAGGNFTLPTTSTNEIPGTWSPAVNNQGTTEYTFTPAQGQCATTVKKTVTVFTKPTVTASADPTTVGSGGTVTLTGTSSVEGTYSWSASPQTSIQSSNNQIATSNPTVNTVYTFTVNYGEGCSTSDDVAVTFNDLKCLDPMKGFTPNGDGKNEKWQVYRDGSCFANVSVDVYNRWGGLVYHADKYNNDWTGQYKGKNVPDATYYYVIKATDYTGRTQIKTGNVTIIR